MGVGGVGDIRQVLSGQRVSARLSEFSEHGHHGSIMGSCVLGGISVKKGLTRPAPAESWRGCRICATEAHSTVYRQSISLPRLVCYLAYWSKRGCSQQLLIIA